MKILTSKAIMYLLLAIPSILLIIFIILFVRTSNELYKLKNEHVKAIESYEKELNELTTRINMNLPKEKRIITENFDFFIQRLKKKGLSNPVQDIISDLMKHSELIPYEPKPGGVAHFYEKEIWILNNRWILASVTDGHWGGYLLLEYDITDSGNIKWKRIAAMR
jgi:hypothetical protein